MEDSLRIEQEVKDKYDDDVIDRKVCVVTDGWIFRKEATCVVIGELPFDAMKLCLGYKSWTTPHMIKNYDCSSVDGRLQDMLLSIRAFEVREGRTYVWITTRVLKELQATQSRLKHNESISEVHPPRFAIAECFVASVHTEIDTATVVEKQTVGLVQLRGVVKVVYGGPGQILQSHLLCWDNRHATIACQVPNIVEKVNFHLVLAGPITSEQEIMLAKQHECNANHVRDMHSLLRRINVLYGEVAENRDYDMEDECTANVQCSRLEDNDTTSLIAHARARQASVAIPNALDNAAIRKALLSKQKPLLLKQCTTLAKATDSHGRMKISQAKLALWHDDQPRYYNKQTQVIWNACSRIS